MIIRNFDSCPFVVKFAEAPREKNIFFIRGERADLALGLLRAFIGDDGGYREVGAEYDGHFALFGSACEEDKSYEVCYILNAEGDGHNRLSVNIDTHTLEISAEDTLEYKRYMENNNTGTNVLRHGIPQPFVIQSMSEGESARHSLEAFIRMAERSTAEGEHSPLFIYGHFDRLDEAQDVSVYLDRLAALDRQVFVSACASYPTERLAHRAVRTVKC